MCQREGALCAGVRINSFSIWKLSHKHEVILNSQGTLLPDKRLRFICRISNDSLCATRMPHRPQFDLVGEKAPVRPQPCGEPLQATIASGFMTESVASRRACKTELDFPPRVSLEAEQSANNAGCV